MTLQEEDGEGRWAGLGDAIHQVKEWRDVHSQLRTACKTAGVGNSLTSHLDQWHSMIPMLSELPSNCGIYKPHEGGKRLHWSM